MQALEKIKHDVLTKSKQLTCTAVMHCYWPLPELQRPLRLFKDDPIASVDDMHRSMKIDLDRPAYQLRSADTRKRLVMRDVWVHDIEQPQVASCGCCGPSPQSTKISPYLSNLCRPHCTTSSLMRARALSLKLGSGPTWPTVTRSRNAASSSYRRFLAERVMKSAEQKHMIEEWVWLYAQDRHHPLLPGKDEQVRLCNAHEPREQHLTKEQISGYFGRVWAGLKTSLVPDGPHASANVPATQSAAPGRQRGEKGDGAGGSGGGGGQHTQEVVAGSGSGRGRS